MSEAIRVERADIKTCTIEVKVIKIDRRQMTLSVFDQIPYEAILNCDLTWRGQPWGLVRRPHKGTFVLWQKGTELRRCYLIHEWLGGSYTPNRYYGFVEGERDSKLTPLDQGYKPGMDDRLLEIHDQLAILDQLFIAV